MSIDIKSGASIRIETSESLSTLIDSGSKLISIDTTKQTPSKESHYHTPATSLFTKRTELRTYMATNTLNPFTSSGQSLLIDVDYNPDLDDYEIVQSILGIDPMSIRAKLKSKISDEVKVKIAFLIVSVGPNPNNVKSARKNNSSRFER